MSDGTKIEWTDATLNVINGCDIVSPGCTNCYAMRSGSRGLPNHPATGLTKPSKPDRVGSDGSVIKSPHVRTGEVRFNEKALLQPLRWTKPRKIFWNAHGDMFHPKVPDEWIDRCFAVMFLADRHIRQVLTKRPERMRAYLTTHGVKQRIQDATAEHFVQNAPGGGRVTWPLMPDDWPLPNVWLGVSVEDQQRADVRVPLLLDTPAAIRWLSCEPLLGPISLSAWMPPVHHHPANRDRARAMQSLIKAARDRLGGGIDWVVAGGESGRGARPMHPSWARQLRDACAQAGVPFLFKQWGKFAEGHLDNIDVGDVRIVELDGTDSTNWTIDRHSDSTALMVGVGKKAAGRALDGVEHNGFPIA